MNQYYDKVQMLNRRQFQVVDPMTQQTYPHATAQNCSDRIENLFQLGTDEEDS